MTLERPSVADYPAGSHLPARTIDDFELVWMVRGEATVVVDSGGDRADVGLNPGRLALIPPGLRHGFRWDPRRPCRHGYVHFGPEHLPAAPAAGLVDAAMTDDDPLAGLCAHLLRLGQRTDGWREPVTATLRFLLAVLLSHPLPEDDQPRLTKAVAAAVEVLRREWAAPPLRRITVGELASAAGSSPGHLTRSCTATFGMSPAPLLDRLRCSRAETLLTRTDMSAEAIAAACGYADPSHFSHRFTAIHGVSPRTYRIGAGRQPSVLDHPGVRRLARLVWE